jgi:hypothetical protein
MQMERMGTQTHVTMFIPQELYLLVSRLDFIKEQSFDFGLGSRLVQELASIGSFVEGFRNPTT